MSLHFYKLSFRILHPFFATYPRMIKPCPNSECPSFGTKEFIKKDGFFFRKCESRYIRRFQCTCCKRKFSHATGTLEFRQKKRRVNPRLQQLLCNGNSMRGVAAYLQINRKTVERKVRYLARKSRLANEKFLKTQKNKVVHLQFDDLITTEHTKLKPLTVSLAVNARTRQILGAKVARIGAFGHLAELSRKKYGRRENRHKQALENLFSTISPAIAPNALVESDEHKRYPEIVGKYLPQREYKRYPGGRGCIAGQGELKKLHYDPLFILNHTCAMLRSRINRLIRKTWCTTKRPGRLQMHLEIFIDYYNRIYLPSKKPHSWGAV